MKIMYIDAKTDGHHTTYLNALLNAASRESFAVVPQNAAGIQGKSRKIKVDSVRGRKEYHAWIKTLQAIAKEEKPDIVHFLDGDTIMRHFGAGLNGFGKGKVVITFHHFFPGKAREISMKMMLRNAKAGVFHTEEICQKAKAFGCKNAVCISYPCFWETSPAAGKGYTHKPPKLLALGGTRYDKGIDILLEALNFVHIPFRLVIAGKPEDFDEAFIRKKIKGYQEAVEFTLRYLTDEEIKELLMEADVIVLPYRKIFDGASGPMCEGMYLGKTIIGPDHGSLGEAIRKYHIGYTFESENIKSLAEKIEYALENPCVYDEVARNFQQELRPGLFVKRYQDIYS